MRRQNKRSVVDEVKVDFDYLAVLCFAESREIQSPVSPYKMAVSGRLLSVLFVLLVVFLNVESNGALARDTIAPASAPAPEPTSGAGTILPGLLVPVLIALASFLVGRQ
ncbi:hypothetical protein R1sor_013497 [Riccia sorocarpa]|uniref:Uncharacterized protein n=1 Tax=Riccia sorocarpa TaxID=122646 RepID=A0ABD3H7B3_9MARC